ncbi:MAG: phage portal protein [Olsenella sp.]|nr:phage portal protein [Olsenella sp.]
MAENEETQSVAAHRPATLTGRRCIYANCEEITDENVVEVLKDALPTFLVNRAQIRYLWNYYKGKQPILNREKLVRPEINNKVVENHAQEIVMFKIGYQLAEPLQYTLRNHDGTVGPEGEEETDEGYAAHLGDLNELNTLMHAEDKASLDRDLFEHMCVCGLGYRMAEASTDEEGDDAPFDLFVLDPWDTFVVYSNAYHHRPLMAVWVGKLPDGKTSVYNVFTDARYYQIVDEDIVGDSDHSYGHIPIVEYRLNNTRMGVFEPVLPLLDAINAIESNRLDGVEQTVQSLMKFINCDVDETDFEALLALGAVKVHSPEGVKADVDFIKNDLDQTQTQVTKDDLYQAMVNICGMPNRNGTSGSSSDTGAAVLLRDGWTLAESHAKSYELQFKRAERRFLKVILSICEQSSEVSIDLRLRDIELAFNRRNYENVLVKAQVLTTMLDNDGIHPELAFKACGLFTDPEAAYLQSKRWVEERREQSLADAALAYAGVPKRDVAIGSQPTVPEPTQGNDAGDTAIANAATA